MAVLLPSELSLSIFTWPDVVEELVGSKLIFSVTDCPELIVSGNFNPEIEKPVPVTFAELMTSGAEPTDESVTDWVAVEFTATSPNLMAVELTLKAGALRGRRFRASLVEPSLSLAVRAAACAAVAA